MRVITIRTDEGVRNGIELDEARKYRRCLFMNAAGLKVEKVAIGSEEDRTIREIQTPTLSVALKRFRSAAKAFGCTADVAAALGIRKVTKVRDRTLT